MCPRTLTTLLFSLGLALGTQLVTVSTASALPGDIISKSRASGQRTYKGTKGSGKSTSKKKSSKSTTNRSTSNRRVVRTTTSRSSAPARTNVRSSRTVTQTRPSTGHSSTTRTVRNVRPRTTTSRTTTTRTTSRTHLRGHNVRRTTYHSSSSHHSHHSHGHATASTHQSARAGRTHGRSTIEPYVTGGLGISGFASDDIVDGALPGLGYNLAVGAKGKLFGGELGLNGGGYTLGGDGASTDIALIGLSGDLKLQPAISFFEPYIAVGLGGYAMQDAVIQESSAGVGLRVGAGADFRFDNVAVRVHYLFGAYGLNNDNGSYNEDGSVGARTETLGANLVFYF